ncbi:MAG: CPBP family intramembrane metalloprotease [Chloroflexota bacterium]|nr:CPBP family intramembrane metalloprotease [Chloroflexota bacterium]
MNTVPEQLDTSASRLDEHRAPWGLLDILGAVALGAVFAVALAAVVALAIRLLGAAPSNAAQVTLLTAAGYGGIFLGVWLFIVVRRRLPWSAVGFRQVGWGAVPVTLLALVVLTVANSVVLYLMSLIIGPIENPQQESLVPDGVLTLRGYLWLLPALSVVAPLVEELVFRGLLYRYLRGRMSMWPAVLLSAALFAVAHVYRVIMLPLFIAGIALALLAERYKSILPTILLHALFNGVQITLLYLASSFGS